VFRAELCYVFVCVVNVENTTDRERDREEADTVRQLVVGDVRARKRVRSRAALACRSIRCDGHSQRSHHCTLTEREIEREREGEKEPAEPAGRSLMSLPSERSSRASSFFASASAYIATTVSTNRCQTEHNSASTSSAFLSFTFRFSASSIVSLSFSFSASAGNAQYTIPPLRYEGIVLIFFFHFVLSFTNKKNGG
jgi:hypothetical protein